MLGIALDLQGDGRLPFLITFTTTFVLGCLRHHIISIMILNQNLILRI